MLDFEEPGDLGAFVDERTVEAGEATIGKGGIHSGKTMAFVFQMLRANELLWPYVIDNYLKGIDPAAFDLLHWNADATNLPGPMYTWFMRNMYLENRLREPGALVMCGEPVDLGKIDVPSYMLAAHKDHLVPWRAAYRATWLVGGARRFVLAASGHIAGVINPPAANKRSHWTAEATHDDADDWLASATERAGSWWPDWERWLRRHSGRKVPAPASPGNDTYRPIEAAPGRYVKVPCG